MELCIVIIQFCLLILTCLIGWCEISRTFSDTFKSSVVRFTLAVSFLVLGFYAKFLLLAPYLVVFAAFTACVCFTVLFIKLLIHEHDKRVHILNYRKKILRQKIMSAFTELDWIKEARKHVGLKELNGTNKHPTIDSWVKDLGASWVIGQPWCGTFVAHCLKTAGVKYPKNWFRALAYSTEGGVKLSKPCYGCVAVKNRKGGGHVCFVVGIDKSTGKLVCLGGNQSDMVCYALYKESDFESFMWYGRTNSPAQSRYNLPVLQGVSKTNVTES